MECEACEAIRAETQLFGSPVIINTAKIIGYVLTYHATSRGHCIFLPKEHVEKMHHTEDDVLNEILLTIKKAAKIMELENYNILQNNGALAFQTVFHVHFHLIPKYSENDGLQYLRDKDITGYIDQSGIAQLLKSQLSTNQ